MKTRARSLRPLLLLCGALLGATLAPLPLGAQETAAEAEEPAEARDQDREGIKVHGNWVIEVRNPDGTLAERRAFENALTDTGAATLRSLLTTATPGNWGVIFTNSSFDAPCSGGPCGIVEEGSTVLAGNVDSPSEDLSILNIRESIELSGSETVDEDGQIEEVATYLGFCKRTVTPEDCDAPNRGIFTSKTLPDAMDVTAGQSVSVTVIISFS